MSSQEEAAIDRLDFISAKLSFLAECDYAERSEAGSDGLRRLLREISDEVKDISDEIHAELVRLRHPEK